MLIGGFNKLGAGAFLLSTFKDIPSHWRLVISLEFAKLDSWNMETVKFFYNGV